MKITRLEFDHRGLLIRCGPRHRLLPEPQVLRDPQVVRFFLDEDDDPHGTGALGAGQRIDLACLLYQPGPGTSGSRALGGVVLH
jgi:hypothetical protein